MKNKYCYYTIVVYNKKYISCIKKCLLPLYKGECKII